MLEIKIHDSITHLESKSFNAKVAITNSDSLRNEWVVKFDDPNEITEI